LGRDLCCGSNRGARLLTQDSPPNKPIQPTPLRVDKIGAILKGWIQLEIFPELSRRRG
jgi:hypothetical protein